MITVTSYAEGQEITKNYLCAECSAPLLLAWGGYYGINSYVVRCGMYYKHEGIVKPGKLDKEDLPIYIKNVMERKERSQMVEKYGEKATTALAPYQGSTSLTQEQATFILQTCWPKALPTAVLKAAMICHQYGLNPLMKHLHLVEYKGKDGSTWEPIFGISATRLIASRKGSYSYIDGPRIMTEDEQLATFGEKYPTTLCAITVIADFNGNKAPGYGFWPKNKEPYGADKGNTKFNMASIHSERQAFDRLLPGEMPADIEVGDIDYLASADDKPKEKDEKVLTFIEACTKAGYDTEDDGDLHKIGTWLEKHFGLRIFTELTTEAQWAAIDKMRLEDNAR